MKKHEIVEQIQAAMNADEVVEWARDQNLDDDDDDSDLSPLPEGGAAALVSHDLTGPEVEAIHKSQSREFTADANDPGVS